jgi:hypothetical protein
MTMKAFVTPLLLIAALSWANPAAAAPPKPNKLAPTVAPFLDYKNPAAIKKEIADLGFTIGAETVDGTFPITAQGNEYTMAIDDCSSEDNCGSAALAVAIGTEKKPTDGWLARMNSAGNMARVIYVPKTRIVFVVDAINLVGINKEALALTIDGVLLESNAVLESVAKNEHLKR